MKVKELQSILKEKNIDFALLFNTTDKKKDFNATYFSGLTLELMFVIIPKNNKPYVIVNNLEKGRAKTKSIISVFSFEKDLFLTIKKQVGKFNTIGVDFGSVTLLEKKWLSKNLGGKLVDLSKDLKELRETKTKKEIEIIQNCVNVGDEIFDLTIANFTSFNTEIDVKNFIDEQIRRQGFEPAFETIINSGVNACHGHFSAQNEKLKRGFCIIDFGVKIDNYNSDMTRTIFIGKPTLDELNEYERIKKVQQSCIDNVKIGMKFSELDKIARDIIGKNLIHSLGHGLGLEVHEGPSVGPKSKQTIKEGHVFTIEPGVYVKGKYGIRIEDDVVVTKKGCVVLNKSTKNLVIVK